ncbi:MAG: ArsR/SmtB family transcription factor [Solirubrobacteraceae bacterium]
MPEVRPVLTDPEVLEALAHPVRLDVLNYLMSMGPATASTCARAVGDTPSNCSYHLRTLARHGLVESIASPDGRERPWRATITGFDVDPEAEPESPEGRGLAALMAASLALEQRSLRDYLSHRDAVAAEWRAADQWSAYTLRVTPTELSRLAAQLDELIRPLIAATRESVPKGAELVQLGLYAFPRQGAQWSGRQR